MVDVVSVKISGWRKSQDCEGLLLHCRMRNEDDLQSCAMVGLDRFIVQVTSLVGSGV